MNSLDLYEFDLNKPPTPVPPIDGSVASGSRSISPPTHEPTLNEEVTQALGQLGRFWGGFRRQVRITVLVDLEGTDWSAGRRAKVHLHWPVRTSVMS